MAMLIFHLGVSFLPSSSPFQTERSKVRKTKDLALNILLDPHLLSPPKTDTTDGAESKQHAKRNAQAPDSLHLVASRLASSSPDEVVDLGEVVTDGVNE